MHEYMQWQAAIKITYILLRKNWNKGEKLCAVLILVRDRKCSGTSVKEDYRVLVPLLLRYKENVSYRV